MNYTILDNYLILEETGYLVNIEIEVFGEIIQMFNIDMKN